MRAHSGRGAALLLAGLEGLLIAAGLGLMAWNLVEPSTRGEAAENILVGVFAFAFGSVGALLALRRPENAIGWLFLLTGLAWAIAFAGGEYAFAALYAEDSSLRAGESVVWLSSWTPIVGYAIPVALVFLLFPDGRPPSRRWKPIAWLAVVGIASASASLAIAPGPLSEPFEEIQNPYGLEGHETLVNVVEGLGWPLVIAAPVAGVVALVLRLRQARGDEREQVKWVLGAFVLLAALFIAASTLFGRFDGVELILAAGILGVPVATAIAILKYHLYDIDVIIRRTLVYAVLSALLAGLYFGIVLALQQVFSSFAGGSDLAIAVSTLAVAALFRPARRRIQALVDRRFYRRKYDAQRTLEAFSARLRDEIDLDSLSGELRAVVQETMQPAHVSLWLRPGSGQQ